MSVSSSPITVHDRTFNDGGLFALTVLLDSIQDYADEQGLLFDDENRDQIDRVVRALLDRLDTWGDLAALIPPRCLDWRMRARTPA
jgi:hypothetical protein